MRHGRAGKKLGRNSGHRKALFRSLLNAIISHDRIETTLAKAKVIKPQVEKLITLAKRDSFHARGLAFQSLQKKGTVKRLFETVGPRYLDKAGGYSRIIKVGPRLGDAAEMAILELV
ncbi:MAG: 50S ribosomal protein L17 [Candidatus Riflebacteria bacterium]|nr:50S ribosomal protein L17 [Candidatus Riflebacteria bacterium]